MRLSRFLAASYCFSRSIFEYRPRGRFGPFGVFLVRRCPTELGGEFGLGRGVHPVVRLVAGDVSISSLLRVPWSVETYGGV